MNIALIGLQTQGKSSIVNSLVGKRIAETGLCKTTENVTIYKLDNIKSDDGITITLIDFPGIMLPNFDSDYLKMISCSYKKENIHLVIWVTDINTAFLTNYELIEYNKLKKAIEEYKVNTGLGIQLIVIVNKMEYENINDKNETNSLIIDNNEIDSIIPEKTSHHDIYNNLTKIIKEDIICYNAHGRSYYNEKSSLNLKEFVSKYNPNNINIEFNIRKYYENINKINDEAILLYIQNELIKFEKKYNNKTFCDDGYYGAIRTDIYYKSDTKYNDNQTIWCCKCKNSAYVCNELCYKNINDGVQQYNAKYVLMDIKMNSIHYYGCEETYCRHGKKRNMCLINIGYLELCKNIQDKYDNVSGNEIKINIIILLVNSFNSIICHGIRLSNVPDNIKINIMNDHELLNFLMLTDNIYTLYQKLYIYTLMKKSVYNYEYNFGLNIQSIYSLEEFESGDFCNFNKKKGISIKYNKKIFSTKLLDRVKEIRCIAFNQELEKENDIDKMMLTQAYERYGLFWINDE